MRRALLAAALLAAGLGLVRRALEPPPPPVSGDLLRELVPAAEREGLRVAGVTVEGLPQGERFVYVRGADGRWRCPTVHGAVALSIPLEELVAEVLTARAEVVAGGARAAAHGIEAEGGLRLTLHGPRMAEDPARDARLVLELGRSLPGLEGGRGFARLAGSDEVLELDRDPRSRLWPRETGRRLPPLLDERLLAGEFPDLGQGIERAFVDLADGRSLEVRSRVLGPAPAPDRPPPREWIAVEGDRTARCLPYRIGGWQSFLYRVPYLGVAPPSAAARLGLEDPLAKLTLLQVAGEPIELVVGRTGSAGSVFVWNRATDLLCLLSEADAALLLPEVDDLCSTEVANPWEAWLPR